MRYALIGLLVVHGLIHLLGVAKAWDLAAVPQLSGRALFGHPYGRLGGALWLLATVGFLAAAVLVLMKGPAWPVLAGAILLSQALVVAAWPDAKVGTLPNLLLIVVAFGGFAHTQFLNESKQLERDMVADLPLPGPPVTTADLAPLPAPVQRWLQRSGVVGHPIPRTVTLVQSGGMRTKPGADLMPVRAHQIFRTDPPGFVWTVETAMFGLPVVGRDTWLGGRGRMLITATGLFPIVDQADAQIDEGALLRYLAEVMWFPGAALSPAISWAPIDDHSARATLTHGGVRGEATFRFDAEGRVTGLDARRPLGGGKDARMEAWGGTTTAWKVLNTFEIPVEGQVAWKLAEGDFTYYEWRIEAIEYDPR